MAPDQSPPVVVLRGVTKRYGDRVVVHDLELTLSPGQLVMVEGPNGSGKSTLLRLLAGVTRPTAGSVRGLPGRVGYLPAQLHPPGLMRADAYLRHLGRISGLSTSEARTRANALLDLLTIRPGPRHRLRTLSKGNLQKVGIAQVFLAHHDLLVLDEPRTGLELAGWPVLDQLIADEVDRGALVVCAEHDPAVLAGATTRIRLRDGAVSLHSGPPELHPGTPEPTPGMEGFWISACRLTGSAVDPAELVAAAPTAAVEPAADGEELFVRVPGPDKDSVLRWLLGHGWSVTAVEQDHRA